MFHSSKFKPSITNRDFNSWQYCRNRTAKTPRPPRKSQL